MEGDKKIDMNYRIRAARSTIKEHNLWNILFIDDILSRYVEEYCLSHEIYRNDMNNIIIKYGNNRVGEVRVRMLEKTIEQNL